MDRSALVATWSVSLALLLLGLASLVVLLTVAVLVWSPVVEDGTVKSIVRVAEAPEASVPTVQVLLAKLPWLGVAVPSVKPDGKASAHATLRTSGGAPVVVVM